MSNKTLKLIKCKLLKVSPEVNQNDIVLDLLSSFIKWATFSGSFKLLHVKHCHLFGHGLFKILSILLCSS